MQCNSCNATMINGVYCHETGCPDRNKNKLRECKNCDNAFIPQDNEQFCCDNCYRDYYGYEIEGQEDTDL